MLEWWFVQWASKQLFIIKWFSGNRSRDTISSPERYDSMAWDNPVRIRWQSRKLNSVEDKSRTRPDPQGVEWKSGVEIAEASSRGWRQGLLSAELEQLLKYWSGSLD